MADEYWTRCDCCGDLTRCPACLSKDEEIARLREVLLSCPFEMAHWRTLDETKWLAKLSSVVAAAPSKVEEEP